jgi:hypothetical protein
VLTPRADDFVYLSESRTAVVPFRRPRDRLDHNQELSRSQRARE